MNCLGPRSTCGFKPKVVDQGISHGFIYFSEHRIQIE